MEEKQSRTCESHHVERPFTKKARSNPWIISTIVLAVFALILIVGSLAGFGMTGNVISENEAGQIIIDFAEQQTGEEVELVEINEEAGLYEVVILLQGQEVPLYITKDGKSFTSTLISFEEINNRESSQQQESTDWAVFENEIPIDIKSKILSFTIEGPEEYDASLGINQFINYDLIPKTLIVFYSSGCGWCSKYYPVLVEAMEKYPEIIIYALDLNANRDIAEKYGITGTPTNIINGKYMVSGYRPLEDLSEILDKLS